MNQLIDDRVDFLDFLRGVAVSLVFLAHIIYLLDFSVFHTFENLFARGVQLFYLVSGFTIFMIYIDKINDLLEFRNYLIKRFFRIMPLLYILLPIYYIAFGVNIHRESELPDWYHIVSHYLLLFGFHQDTMTSIMGHAWSIFDEFLFYIAFGLLMIRFDIKVHIYKYILVLFMVSFVTFIYNNIYLNDNLILKTYLFLSPFIQMYVFFMGGGIYVISKKYFIPKYLYYLAIVILIFYSFFLTSTTLSVYFTTIIFSILILYMSQNKLHYSKFFLYLGKISFSFYLIHIIVISYMDTYNLFNLSNIILIPLMLITTIILSSLSYKYIEQPFIKFGRKFISIK